MRAAVHHLFQRHALPGDGAGGCPPLERLGVEVDFPLEQTCCGHMHFNTGYAEETIPLVRRFARTFADSEVVVSPSSSCVGMVRDYSRVAALSGDAGLQHEVDALAPGQL